jgi:hypothetical protein
MAWDSIIQGLIHWDRLDPKPDIQALLASPMFSENKYRNLQNEVMRLTAENLQQSNQINMLLNCLPIKASRFLGVTFPTVKSVIKKLVLR